MISSKPASKIFLVPDPAPYEPEMWEVHCHCGAWDRGGYYSNANARRALSQHQARTHPGDRG